MRKAVLDLQQEAEKLGLTLHTHSPGDGITRYRFCSEPADSFFAGNGAYTALGLKEACTFLEGVRIGKALEFQQSLDRVSRAARALSGVSRATRALSDENHVLGWGPSETVIPEEKG